MSRSLHWLYSGLLLLVLVAGAPWWLFRMLTSGRYRAGLAERLGRMSTAVREVPRDGRVIWVHAVSVGEVLAAVGLVGALQAALPGWTVAVSTTTATGQALARRRLRELGCPVFYLPLDFAVLMRRLLRRLRPGLVVLMESELWPNLLLECARAGVPVTVANARVSDRSYPRYLRLRRLWRPLFRRVSRFLAQGQETAERLRAVGASPEQVVVTGNLKFDLLPPSAGVVTEAVGRWLGDRLAPVLVVGSTLEGEDEMVLAAWREVLAETPGARLVLAPRHPDRFGRVAKLIADRGFGCVRASELVTGGSGREEDSRAAEEVVLLDTVGDLAAVYGLATVALVGGSLVPAGGHNPLEPARFAVPVLVGPSTENFREVVGAMLAVQGVRSVTEGTLAGELLRLFHDPEAARALGQRGQSVFATETGATERTVRELLTLLCSGRGDAVAGGVGLAVDARGAGKVAEDPGAVVSRGCAGRERSWWSGRNAGVLRSAQNDSGLGGGEAGGGERGVGVGRGYAGLGASWCSGRNAGVLRSAQNDRHFGGGEADSFAAGVGTGR